MIDTNKTFLILKFLSNNLISIIKVWLHKRQWTKTLKRIIDTTEEWSENYTIRGSDGWHIQCHRRRMEEISMCSVVKWQRSEEQGIISVLFWVTPLRKKENERMLIKNNYTDFSFENMLWVFNKWYCDLSLPYWRSQPVQ